MASDDDKRLIDEGLDRLAKGDRSEDDDETRGLEALADRVEEPGLQDRILERYTGYGRELLSDALPTRLDPRLAKRLEKMLGPVDDVRVHTGRAATHAARSMGARAFALGDQDIFVDEQQFNPQSRAGGALLAHEVAHTRDAATGFALSQAHGGSTSSREQFAEMAEMELARDETATEPSTEEPIQAEAAQAAAGPAGSPEIDKADLEDRIWAVLEAQGRAARDRSGH